MNYERLGMGVHRLDGESEQLASNMKKQAEEQARIEERLEPFKGLQILNEGLHRSASRLIEADPNYIEHAADEDEEQRVCVVLGEVETAPGSMLIAQLTRWGGDNGYGMRRNIKFEFFKARKPAFAREVGKKPGDYRLTQTWAVDTEKLQDLDEETYIVADDESKDKIAELARKNVTGGRFFGNNGVALYKKISRRLQDLERTVEMVNEAAHNHALNPVLAAALEEDNKAIQDQQAVAE